MPTIRTILLAMLLAAPAGAQATHLLERREVRADGHPLSVWSKRPGTRARGSIVLVHGRTWSSRPNWDLQVPGQRVSLMDALVARGYAVYAIDLRGYGGTPRDSTGWLTPDRAERDVESVLDWVKGREAEGASGRTTPRPVLLGYSQGSMVAHLVAQRHPEKLGGVILYGFPYDVTRSPGARVDAATPERRRTTVSAAEEDFISPAATPPGVKEAYGKTAVTTDSIRADWRLEGQFMAMDPAALNAPTLLLDGERDPYANAANHGAFFPKVATHDKWWVVLPGVDHAAHLEHQQAFVNAVTAFMERASAPPSRQ